MINKKMKKEVHRLILKRFRIMISNKMKRVKKMQNLSQMKIELIKKIPSLIKNQHPQKLENLKIKKNQFPSIFTVYHHNSADFFFKKKNTAPTRDQPSVRAPPGPEKNKKIS